ncbi:ADP-ribosylglycohydrolase family protein [Streptomyces armeniacus]|uniref:ADP-ribosylglycohydrolase family protein n=1 Tax=Streptomyces armeniacus TaxID=83291 RepID=A0A345XZ55_9ACTN|nr:ADP-ribosylglycohydrolase family protein [Streptomyces armeniacus]
MRDRPQGGTAGEALSRAVACALVAGDVQHGLLLGVTHGGDSGATGSICGNLLGTINGETALPPGWVAELEGRATILELADDFAMEMTQGPALHSPASSQWWIRDSLGAARAVRGLLDLRVPRGQRPRFPRRLLAARTVTGRVLSGRSTVMSGPVRAAARTAAAPPSP